MCRILEGAVKGPDSGRELIQAMIKGGERAVSDFSCISGGEWFDEAPEYFLTTYVAWAVGNLESSYVLLEVSVDQARKEAGALRRGRPSDYERRNGRFDVVLYWANDKPRGAIDIKTRVWAKTENQFHPDIHRLCSVLSANRDSTFQFCVFLYYASVGTPNETAVTRLRDLLGRIKDDADQLAREHGVEVIAVPGKLHPAKGMDVGAWCISTLVFTKKGGMPSFRQ